MALLREDQSFPLLDSSAYTMVHVNTPSGEFVRISCISVVGWTAPISALYRAMLEDLRRVPVGVPRYICIQYPVPSLVASRLNWMTLRGFLVSWRLGSATRFHLIHLSF